MKTEIIRTAIKRYGNLIEKGTKIDSYRFAKLIADNYSLSNPISKMIWNEVRDNYDLLFSRANDGFVQVSKI